MNTYDAKCPVCGKINRNLYMDETGGWMECDSCFNVTLVLDYSKHVSGPFCKMKGAPHKITSARAV